MLGPWWGRGIHGCLLVRVERQHTALVLQQHHRAGGGTARGVDRIGPQHLLLGLIRLVGRVRVLEQVGAELDPQDPAHRVVQPAQRDAALRDQLGAEVAHERAGHLRVHAGVERERGGGMSETAAAGAASGVDRRT
jgi:hypothetical protein